MNFEIIFSEKQKFTQWWDKIEKAYNVSGSQGLQLELKNGKKLLIGTQKPDEISAALIKLGRYHQ